MPVGVGGVVCGVDGREWGVLVVGGGGGGGTKAFFYFFYLVHLMYKYGSHDQI